VRAGVLVLIIAGLLPGFGVYAAERLGADGFPADWTPEDLKPKMLVPAARDEVRIGGAVSATLPVVESVVKEVSGLAGYGPLTAANGGESVEVWQAAPRNVQEAGLKRAVSDGLASPALKEAWRRLLLTQAKPPVGVGTSVSGTNWLGIRAEGLENLGFYEAAWSLWKEVPLSSAKVEDGLLYGAVKSRILAGDDDEACAVAKQKTVHVAAYDNRWPVVVAACQILAPRGVSPSAGASLSVQLVEQVLRAQNPGLLKIMNAVQDGKAVTSGLAKVDALGGAVLADYPALVGLDVVPKLPDVALRRLAGTETLPLDLRARAAVALATTTRWPKDGEQAWALVSETLVSDSTAPIAYTPWPDAMILARGVVGVNSNTGVVRESAAAYVRAALRNDDTAEAAKAWPLWKMEGLKGNDLRAWWQAQMAAAILQGKVEMPAWQGWLGAMALDTQAGAQQAQRTLLVADALGVVVPREIWQQLRDKALPVAAVSDPAWQRLMDDAVGEKNLPGVLGLVSEKWRHDTGDKVAPEAVGASITALKKVGQIGVARRLAAEAMLGVKENVYVAKPGAVERQPTARPMVMEPSLSKNGGIEDGSAPKVTAPRDLPGMLPPPRVQIPVKPVPPTPPKI
jgi:hypothetical protein